MSFYNTPQFEAIYLISKGNEHCHYVSKNCLHDKEGIFIRINSDDRYCYAQFCENCWQQLNKDIQREIKELKHEQS